MPPLTPHPKITSRVRNAMLLGSVGFLIAVAGYSFPPAPHHLIFGMVRDEYGDPISTTNAIIIFQTSSGQQIQSRIQPNLEPGANYRITVPMDSGVTTDAYKETALNASVSFKIRVRIGQTTYLPIEMVGDFSHLGAPGGKTRIDLTLGEDSDGDGLPDAWERALISLLGGTRSLADIRPQDDPDGDGLSNLHEYLAGTFAFDSRDGFSVNLLDVGTNGVMTVEFLGIRGRTYSVHSSSNLTQWTAVPFKVAPVTEATPRQMNLRALEVRRLRLQIDGEPGQLRQKYLKLMLE